jgi:ketosteroid isomerase-like protein
VTGRFHARKEAPFKKQGPGGVSPPVCVLISDERAVCASARPFGWDAQKKYWADTDKLFSTRNITLSDQHIHVNGNLAWEMGQESGTPKMKDGKDTVADYIVTNVYERIGGRWLIVSHHVQPKPQ